MNKDKEEILYEQLEKQYELNKIQTEALCNVVNSLKSVFQYLIIGAVIIGVTVVISYFWSPDSYSINNSNATQTNADFNVGGEN